MKVLFLLNIPSPYRVDFLNELSNYCELTVVYERKNSKERNSEWTSLSNGHYKEIFLKTIASSVNTGFSFSVLKYIAKRKYDRIIVGGYSTPCSIVAMLKMKVLHIPYVLNADGGIIQNENVIKKFIKKILIRGANKYLSTGKSTDRYFIYYGANPENVYHYPFTSLRKMDIQKSVVSDTIKMELRRKLGLPVDDRRIVIAVGQFIRRKGFDTLLEIWERNDMNAYLLLIGDGPLRSSYLERKKENVIIQGFKKKEELSRYYLASDVFVLPTREDIWGLVINEAMANGLPVISTYQCVAACELVENDENGFLFESDDATGISSAIQYLIERPDKRREYGENNIRKIRNFTIEEMAKTTYEIVCS